jgi:hypothetical protein
VCSHMKLNRAVYKGQQTELLQLWCCGVQLDKGACIVLHIFCW